MSYQDTCAANPAKTPCPFSCVCQGHTKVYPNQDCQCGPSKETPVEKDGTDVFQERFDKDAEDRVPAAHQTSEERYAEQADRKPVTLRDLLANPTKPVAATNDEMKDLVAKYFDAYPGLKEWAADHLGIENTPVQDMMAAAHLIHGEGASIKKTVASVRQSMDSYRPALILDLGVEATPEPGADPAHRNGTVYLSVEPKATPDDRIPPETAQAQAAFYELATGMDFGAARDEAIAKNLRATYDKARGRIQRSTREEIDAAHDRGLKAVFDLGHLWGTTDAEEQS